MKAKSLIFNMIFICLVLFLSGCNDSKTEKLHDLDLYLLIGQSNMSGRAAIGQEFLDTLSGVYLLKGDSLDLWEPAANPLNKYSTIRKNIEMQRLGPGYSFAKQMRKQFPEREIGLVVNARGGTSILKWTPGTSYYNEAVSRANLAREFGSLKGILWLQGESDLSRTDIYMDTLIYMINSMRKDFKQPDLPFIACELSLDKPIRKPFNSLLGTLPDHLENTGVVSSEGTATIDSTHFNSESQRILGERYADKMAELLKN